MMRGMTLLWGALAISVGVGLFLLKHQVQETEAELRRAQAQIRADHSAIHVLNAEWAYLNDPARLAALAERVLGMVPVAPQQMVSMNTLPVRAGAAPSGPVGDQPGALHLGSATPWTSFPHRKPGGGSDLANAGGNGWVAPMPVGGLVR